jgi:hypothetical protein
MLKSNFLSVNEDWLAFTAGASKLRIVAKNRSHRRLTYDIVQASRLH